MPDLLSTSLSGMAAFQRALQMTGHNVANANTPGYSRQVAEFVSREGTGTGNGYIGAGTRITTIKRVYDEILGQQLQSSTTQYARYDTLNGLASRLDSLLANPDTGLNAGLQSFFGSLQDLANDPSSLPSREALLGEAQSLAQRFRALDGQLAGIDAEIDQRLRQSVGDINELTDAIAEINDRIVLAQNRLGQPPNDLLDQRDLLVRELSGKVQVSTVKQDDGSMNVFLANGQNLVLGTESRHLAVQGSEFDPTRLDVAYGAAGGTVPLGTDLIGGALGGLLDFRAEMLDPARQALGETAVALSTRFNEQHATGMDLRGALGGEFFSVAEPRVLASSRNSGTGTATAAVGDVAAITGVDYVLSFDGAAYSLTRADDGQPVPMSGSGTAGDPFVADGLSITVGGAPAAGDRLLISPTTGVASSLERAISDPQAIAMAAPTRIQGDLGNVGDATVTQTTVVDAADPDLASGAVIEFTGPNAYTIDGAGPFAYSSGDPIVVNGSEFTISGVPAAGDRFTLEANSGASGDNRNGLALADVQTDGILDGGTIGINDNYGQLVANVGSATRQLQMNVDAQGVILANAEDTMLSNSGVNLDEEAANMLRYQQAFQAAAQVISVAQTLFDTVIAATRR